MAEAQTVIGSTTSSTPPASTAASAGSSGSSSSSVKPYYPKTDVEYGVLWNDGEVTKPNAATSTYTAGPRESIRHFMNSLKLRRIGVSSPDFYLKGIVSREVTKNGASSNDWEYGEWSEYKLTREDMIELFRAG